MKKIFLLFVLFLSVLSTFAYDVEIDGIYYNLIPKAKQASVTSNGWATYYGDVIIPNTIDIEGTTYTVVSIGNSAFEGSYGIYSVTIPNTVNSIGSSAFYSCSNLVSINIPNSVESIGENAFNQCGKLTSICIPNSVTNFGASIFANCYNLSSVIISDGVKTIGDGMFMACPALCNIILPNSITSIGAHAFYQCPIESVILPNSLSTIGYAAFCGCASLIDVTITCSYLSINPDAFYNCTKLKEITFICNTSLPYISSSAFANCENLETVTITSNKPITNFNSTASNAFDGSYIEYATLYIPAGSDVRGSVWENFGTITTMGTIPVDSINIMRDSIELYIGNTDTLAVEVFPDYAEKKTVLWSSSDNEVVSVDEKGVVTAKAGGSAYIYASSTDGSNVVDSCYVLVRVDVESIEIVADTTLLCVGDTDSLSVVVLPDNATYKDVVWSSAKPEIVSVDSTGVITALDYGTAYIYATATDGSEVVDSCLITVKAELFELNDSIVYLSEETFPCDTLTYTRNFPNTNWNALYVPFAMQYDDWADDFEVARLNDVHQFDDDEDGVIDRTVLESVKLKEGSRTEPNTPYMIKAKMEGEKTITLTDATLYATEENSFDVTSWFTKFTFTGTYNTVTDMATAGHYAMADGGLKQASSDDVTLGSFRWYLDITDRNGNPTPLQAKNIFLSFDDGETTEIEVVNAQPENNGDVYSISGVKVGNDINVLPKGLYIMNGKKVLVK